MEIVILCGPPGSGKSVYSKGHYSTYTYINQDTQGKDEHFQLFNRALEAGKNIVVDRMNFSKVQRDRYLNPGKELGYKTKIIVLHQSYETCLKRCELRADHPTIKTKESAEKALNFFFSKYERPEDNESDIVERIWPDNFQTSVIICDLDGTLCNIDHRLNFVRKEGKKDWKSFFEHLINDSLNYWCADLLSRFKNTHSIVFCSGRSNEYEDLTRKWLDENVYFEYNLFMRYKSDYRRDDIVKEILLDFEILTRYKPYLVIDDRQQVVDMWRKRGLVCLDCAGNDF